MPNYLKGHASYAYNRITPLVQGDITSEEPALDKLCEEAKKDKDFEKVAKVVPDNVPRRIAKTMDNHPIKEFKDSL